MLKHVLIGLILTGFIAAEPASKPAVSQEGKIITDDLLRVGIGDLTGPGIVTHFKRRVDGELNLSLPLLKPLSVKEMTLADAQKAIVKAYFDANLMPHAQVTVERVESGTNPSIKSGPITVGDSLEIEIYDLEGPGIATSVKAKVPEGGMVNLPKLGVIRLSGMTEAKAQDAIRVAYRKANVLPNANVMVLRVAEKVGK